MTDVKQPVSHGGFLDTSHQRFLRHSQKLLDVLRRPATRTVRAESAWYPFSLTPRSMPAMSPLRSTRCDGIPCTTASFIDKQIAFGYPRYPLKDGVPPAPVISFSASALSSSPVVLSALIAFA